MKTIAKICLIALLIVFIPNISTAEKVPSMDLYFPRKALRAYQEGNAHLREGDYKNALRSYKEAIYYNPEDIYYQAAGEACYRSKQFGCALLFYKSALNTAKDIYSKAYSYEWLAKIYRARGQNKQALACLKKTIKRSQSLKPNDRLRFEYHIYDLEQELASVR